MLYNICYNFLLWCVENQFLSCTVHFYEKFHDIMIDYLWKNSVAFFSGALQDVALNNY